MRRSALIVAVLAMSWMCLAPASAVTAGQKCSPLHALAKSGSTKMYCGMNANTKTAKKLPLVWKKNADCYDMIEFQTRYTNALAEVDRLRANPDLTADMAKIVESQALTLQTMAPAVETGKKTIKVFCK